MYTPTKHRKCQLIVTVAILVAMVAHYGLEFFLPQYKVLAPLAGALASLVWVWVE